MLKISQVETPGRQLTFKLEGRLVGPWIKELTGICEPRLADGSPLALDLGEVAYAAEDGIALLIELQDRGVTFENMTPFLTEQIRLARLRTPATD